MSIPRGLQTYLRVFCRLKDLRDPLAFPGWLRRVAVTTARSLARARRRYFLEAEGAADVPVLDEQEAAWTHEQRAALARAVLALPADDRTPCDRYYHGGWTTARLAEDGGVTEAAVHSVSPAMSAQPIRVDPRSSVVKTRRPTK